MLRSAWHLVTDVIFYVGCLATISGTVEMQETHNRTKKHNRKASKESRDQAMAAESASFAAAKLSPNECTHTHTHTLPVTQTPLRP